MTHRVSSEVDHWFGRKIGFERELFLGTTDSQIRRERIRTKILERHLEDVRLGNRDGVDETFREAFERIYGLPLHVEQAPTTLELLRELHQPTGETKNG